MVKKVTAWRAASAEAGALWQSYAAASEALQAGLQQLCAVHASTRKTASALSKLRSRPSASSVERDGPENGLDAEWGRLLARCGAADPEAWPTMGSVGAALAAVRTSCVTLRGLVRHISRLADTPIEPPEQTALLDATMAVRGVLMAVVPGAGGNDAVLALVLPTHSAEDVSGGLATSPSSTETTRAAIAKVWREWPASAPPPRPSAVCELDVAESRAAAGAHGGVRLEGEKAKGALRDARTAPSEAAPEQPQSPHAGLPRCARRLLRVLTASELEARELAAVRREVGMGALAIALAVAGLCVGQLLRARASNRG
jgi:phosphomevalonate kinase